jgi:hypothetical protein
MSIEGRSGKPPIWGRPIRRVTLISGEDENLIVPIHVAEDLFEGDWRPSVGKYVTGNLWMQAYAKALL